MPLIRIIGVGNPLRGDDGVGCACVAHLAGRPLPPGVEAVDAGAGGLALLHLLDDAAGVVVVDAAQMGLAPGTIRRFSGEDLVGEAAAPCLGFHGWGVADTLALARELGRLPPVVLLLVQAARHDLGAGLTAAVAGALEEVCARAVSEALRLAQRVGPPRG